MNPYIKWANIILIVTLFILVQAFCLHHAPNHMELLTVFFWELPKELIRQWTPFI